jgi:phospholipase A1
MKNIVLRLLVVMLGTTLLYAVEPEFCKTEIDKSQGKIDIDDIMNRKSRENMEKWLNGTFGLKPYKDNYIIPFGYASKKYQSHKPDITYDNKEAELQVSLKLKIYENFFGLGEQYYLSYTQHAFWQIYIESSPFRESIYNPEGFVVFPISDTKSWFQMRSFKFAVAHMSNGQPNTTEVSGFNGFNLSKSINYFYATARFQHGTLLTDITLKAPFPGSANLSDNPDIMKYMGYTKVKFTYFLGDNMFSLMLRGNESSLKGAVEAKYSYPLYRSDTYLYVKIFHGYGESLIDYNREVTKFSIGFSFSR